MPRTAARFKQADVSRIFRAAKQERVPVAVDILPDGTIRVHVNSGHSVQGEVTEPNKASETERELNL